MRCSATRSDTRIGLVLASWLLLQAVLSATAEPDRWVLAADYSTQRIGLVTPAGDLAWEHPVRDIHDASFLENSNILFQTSWTQILEVNPRGEVVWSYDASRQNRQPSERVEVHSFQRLPDQVTLIAESGAGRLIEVDAEGNIWREIPLQRDRPDLHGDTRIARKLPNGHYLVAQEADGKVREYDPAGTVVWEFDAQAQVYAAQRLTNGHTLVSCGSSGRLLEVTPDHRIVWSLERNDLPEIHLVWITSVERLSSGNTLLVNCHAGPRNPQILEVTPEMEVVWGFHDFQHFANAMTVGQVLMLSAPPQAKPDPSDTPPDPEPHPTPPAPAKPDMPEKAD